MGISGNSNNAKNFQSFTVSEDLLAKVTEAVQAGEKEARSSGIIQSFEVFYHGFRQNIAIGRIFLIPASICSDRKNFPTALLYGSLVREFGSGEEMGDLIEKQIGESEFDEYSQADFDTIKEKLFGVGGGKFESLVLFAPSWLNCREFIVFKFSKDEDKLKNNLRHQVFSAYYDPRLSSAFDALMTNVNTTKIDVVDITPKINFPFLAENLLTQYPNLQKRAGNKKKIFLTHHTAEAITQEVLDPQELDVFDSLDQALSEATMPGTETVEEASEPDAGGFNAPDPQNIVPRVAAKKKADTDKKPEVLKGEGPIGIAIDETGVPRNEEEVRRVAARPNGYMDKTTPENTRGNPCAKCSRPILDGEATNGSVSAEAHVKCPSFGPVAPQQNSFYGSKSASAWAKFAGKSYKTAKIKLTFGTNNVFFDMNGTKYVLDGAEAEQFLEEWLPIYHKMHTQAEAERDRVVEQLAQKYMNSMKKRPEKVVKSLTPPKSMTQHASKEAAFEWRDDIGKDKKPVTPTDSTKCSACNGSGHYDVEGSPKCSSCGGTGQKENSKKAKRVTLPHPEKEGFDNRGKQIPSTQQKTNMTDAYAKSLSGGFVDKRGWPPKEVTAYINSTSQPDQQSKSATDDHAFEINTGKWGPNPYSKSSSAQHVKMADYVADHIAMEIEDNSEVSSPKEKKSRAEQESKLAKNRQKQADVSLTLDSIWNEITEDFGPAPLVDIPENGGSEESNSDSSEPEKKEGPSRPRKSDIGKFQFKKKDDDSEPEEKNDDKEPEEKDDKEEPETKKEKWHVGSKFADFVADAMRDMPAEAPAHEHDDFFEKESGLESPNEEWQCQDCGHEGELQTNGSCEVCGSQSVTSVHNLKTAEEGEEFVPEGYIQDDREEFPHTSSDVNSDFSEAKSEVVSPDTVDSSIHQETKSVAEAAKVSGKIIQMPNKDRHGNPDPNEFQSEIYLTPEEKGLGDQKVIPRKRGPQLVPDKKSSEKKNAAPVSVADYLVSQGFREMTGTHDEVWYVKGNNLVQIENLSGMRLQPQPGVKWTLCDVNGSYIGGRLDTDYSFLKERIIGKGTGVVQLSQLLQKAPKKAAKVGSDVNSDLSEALSEVVSPDTVDSTIHQETKSVSEAAKVSSEVNGDLSEAKSELDAGAKAELADNSDAIKTVNPDHFACSKCGSDDTETMDVAEGKLSYCYSCDKVSAVKRKPSPDVFTVVQEKEYLAIRKKKELGQKLSQAEALALDNYENKRRGGNSYLESKSRDLGNLDTPNPYPIGNEHVRRMFRGSAGDDMPEEIPFDFGEGDLANIVMYEEENEPADEE